MRAFLSLALTLALVGCSKEAGPSTASTQQAVERVQNAYAAADPATKQTITNMSEAMRKGDYEQAVMSLTTVRSVPASTPEQHEAVIQSARAIEADLIQRIAAGDKNAERAYQLMKELKRD